MKEQNKKTNNFSDEHVPDWAKGKLYYQLFVDRFCKLSTHNLKKRGRNYHEKWNEEVLWKPDEKGEFNNNDFFGGDLKGITSKMNYFKDLGVQIIYLSPINYSKYRYDHYAVTDLFKIDPYIGNEDDLKKLARKAHMSGIKIILDVAFNHCGIDNPIAKDVLLKGKDSKYYDCFLYDEKGVMRFYGGFTDMPLLNQENKTVIKIAHGFIRKMCKYVDGFRLDLAECLNPNFLKEIKDEANKYAKHLIVGEFWGYVPREIFGNGIDASTGYSMTNAILKFVAYGEGYLLKDEEKRLEEKYPQENLDSMLVSLSTHDIVRARTILGKKDLMRKGYINIWDIDKYPTIWHNGTFDTLGFRTWEYENDKFSPKEAKYSLDSLKVATVLQYFYIGSPCIYYGDETGMSGFKDPFNRKPMNWGNINRDLLMFFRRLGRFRKNLNLTKCNPNVIIANENIFSFTRNNKQNYIFVAVNRSEEKEIIIHIPEEVMKKTESNTSMLVHGFEFGTNVLKPMGYLVIAKTFTK